MTAKKIVAGSTNAAFRQQKVAICREIIDRVIGEYFKDTLGQISGLADTYIRLLSKESSLNEVKTAVPNYSDGWWTRHLAASPSVRKAYAAMTSIRGNAMDPFIKEVCAPHGVGQVMGYHMVRDLVTSDRKTYVEIYKGRNVFELVMKKNGGTFLVNANAAAGSINNNFSGTDALENGIRASLAVFASKYEKTRSVNGAIMSYFGAKASNPNARDANGTTGTQYVADITGGTGSLAVAQPNAKNNLTLAKNVDTSPETNSNKAAKPQWSCTT